MRKIKYHINGIRRQNKQNIPKIQTEIMPNIPKSIEIAPDKPIDKPIELYSPYNYKDPSTGIIYYSGRNQGLIDKYLIENIFKNKRNGTCMECGALDGYNLSISKVFEESFGWKSINVEADPNSYAILVKNRPLSLNYNYIMHDIDDIELNFHVNIERPKLSQAIDIDTLDKKYHKHCTNILTKSYKSIIEMSGIKELDLFILDVEGHEGDVIKGMAECSIMPNVLLIEVHHKDLVEFSDNVNRIIDLIYGLTGISYYMYYKSGYNTVFVNKSFFF